MNAQCHDVISIKNVLIIGNNYYYISEPPSPEKEPGIYLLLITNQPN